MEGNGKERAGGGGSGGGGGGGAAGVCAEREGSGVFVAGDGFLLFDRQGCGWI